MGHNFLSTSVICGYLLTPPFGRMRNLNVNAIYIGEQIVALQICSFQLPMNHLQRGKSTKAKISSCQTEVCLTWHSPVTFLLKPPASEPQLGRQKEVGSWAIFPDISRCTDYWLREKRESLGFKERIWLALLLKSLTDQFLPKNIDWSSPVEQTLYLAEIRKR